MPQRAERDDAPTRYPLRFGTAAFLLISLTLVLVLVVIPQRYVLSPGFTESGLRFPPPTTPFLPAAAVSVPASPLPSPAVALPTSAELLWDELTPLLDGGRFGAALPVLERYLETHPGDRAVRHELVIALLAAGRPEDAVEVLRGLLGESPDRDARLLLARTLRDMGRVRDAAREYAILARDRPGDADLAVEWARAHAWVEDYETAAEILERALASQPSSISVRTELAHTYYATEGRLHDAIRMLASLSESDLAGAESQRLWSDVVGSLSIVPSVASAPSSPSLLEQAVGARDASDFVGAKALLERALARSPRDRELWLAYANLLEYELAELESARDALLEAERIGPSDPAIQLRLAQLDLWTGRNAEAQARLLTLLAALDAGAVGSAPVARADVHAQLGDLHRWEGRRSAAARQYRLALAERPDHARASEGLAALEEEVTREVLATERPRAGGMAYSLADTDDYGRLDVGGEWIDVDDQWVWGGVAGSRWLQGYDLTGAEASRDGLFVDLDVAGWWRWGTLRTGFDFGAQRILADWDVHVGASLRLRSGGDADTELRYEHGPAHPLAGTLQSALAEVDHDRLTLSHARRLGERWSLAAVADAAHLRVPAAPSAGPGSSTRLQLALTAGRSLSRTLTLGLATRALTFTNPAPLAGVGVGARPLFWDPRLALSVGPFAALDHPLSSAWRLTGRLNPGLALIDERRPAGTGLQLVPHVSVEVGARHEGPHLWTAVDLFYYQGQFDGYRAYGARMSIGARRRVATGGSR